MAECSQEFEDLLVKHEEECFDDWVLNIRSPGCADAKAAILQYVAELEVERDGLRARLDSALAECSQEFKDMLWKYAEQLMSDSDGTHEPEADPSNVLQYVAALEAIRDKVREVVGPLASDMVGGMP